MFFIYPKNFKEEQTSLWSFIDRGKWATHSGDYRGNCSPYVVRNILLKYTNENDLILDPFCGSGTTLIECKLLKRKSVGIDINPKALKITKERISFNYNLNYTPLLLKGDSTNLSKIPENKFDLIFVHPPYANIIKYSENISGDISRMSYTDFLKKIDICSKEFFRILKKGKICSVIIGDIRENGNVIPLGFNLLNIFITNGFIIKEIVIKEQHNCKGTDYWKKKKRNFLILAHEYIFILKKC